MATLVFSTVGTALGGSLGGAIGALAGRQLDGALFGPAARQGARLRELEVSLSSYGTALPRIYGRMRAAGSIIWATELQEHSETQAGGKGQPALTSYSYTANLAIALSSRPIAGLGRVWADGNLLRGAAGDLKAGGTLRVYNGDEDQQPDPLILAAEGEALCPAFRGLAYVVFEALDLTDFGNRIPALTFEVLADDGVRLGDMLGDSLPQVQVPHEIEALAGFAIEDSLAASLASLAPVVPVGLDAAGDTIVARVGTGDDLPLLLDEAAVAVDDDVLSATSGSSRKREAAEPQGSAVLRYFDVERDYLAGTQHASGRAKPGQPDVIELPAALTSASARVLVEQVATRRRLARDQVAWRTAMLNPRIAPGTRVCMPDRAGTWQVESWEWREAGVELELTRIAPRTLPSALSPPTGVFAAPVDLPAAETRLVAVELPWDGADGAPDRARFAAAVDATGPAWSGAALYADGGDGQLRPVGSASRRRAIVGTACDALAPASPLLIDRGGTLTVALAATDQALISASVAELAAGANLALIGEELVQFARAEPLGGGQWRLSGFVRGCGGTEAAIASHVAGEPFALLDSRLTLLDAAALDAPTSIAAIGRGDAEPVTSPLHLAGIALRPLAPVHARATEAPDGSLHLSWTRRARGGWPWRDGVDVPLVEESESYLVTYEDQGKALRAWSVGAASLAVAAAERAQLVALAPDGAFAVRQQGTHALSLPTIFATP